MKVNVERLQQHARHYTGIGLALVPMAVGRKFPTAKGWNLRDNVITTRQQAHAVFSRAQNMGILHSASGTCAVDVDQQDWAEAALAKVGIDLQALQAGARIAIRGAKGVKPLYRLPEGVELSHHKLAFPDPTRVDKAGRALSISVLELRAGSVQDVVAPSIHPEGMEYGWVGRGPCTREDIELIPDAVLDLWLNWEKYLPLMMSACTWAAPEKPAEAPRINRAPRAPLAEGESVIGAWNARTDVSSILAQAGYKIVGSRAEYPGSTSHTAGVNIIDSEDGLERAYSHHPGDPLANGHAHTSFDCYCILMHGGDVRAAVKAAAAELGMTRTRVSQTDTGIDLDAAKGNWNVGLDETIGSMIGALDQVQMHHHAKKASVDLLANVYYCAGEGKLQVVNGRLCVMVGGMAALAAELGGRPADISARLKLLADHGFIGSVSHSDPKDRRSALLIELPASPADLGFRRLTPEGLHALILRPDTVDARRGSERKTPYTTSREKLRPTTGGVRKAAARNPLQDAMRVAFVLSQRLNLSLKELAKAAHCQQTTARKHLGILTEAGVCVDGRLTVSFRVFWATARAAVADRTVARMRGYWERALQFAQHHIRLARFGSKADQRALPARIRLLHRAQAALGLSDAELLMGVAA